MNTSNEALASAVVTSTPTPWVMDIEARLHRWQADEPEEEGGGDTAATPYENFLAALGSCTNVTVQMYAAKKGWPLESIEVRLSLYREGNESTISRDIELSGALDDSQRQRLLAVANACPVHKVLTQPLHIQTSLQ